jgi:hypothetical protein
MKDGVLHDEIIYREHLITVHKIRDGEVVLYYASVMEVGFVFSGFDVDFCIEQAMKRIDTIYAHNEYY